MAENKTQKTDASVEAFLATVEPEQKRRDSEEIIEMMRRATGDEPAMWGPSIIGFGDTHYVYESGREGDSFKVGFSPRKASLTLYVMAPTERLDEYLSKLGKHKTSKACLYINKLDDVDTDVLESLIQDAAEMSDAS